MKPEYPLQISNLVAKTAATDKKKKKVKTDRLRSFRFSWNIQTPTSPLDDAKFYKKYFKTIVFL